MDRVNATECVSKKTLISIITVTYNDSIDLERTIQSVINQTYTNIEYIIVDGGSTDKTIQVLNKYKKSISCWVSEKDKGIYDAMNKGVLKASNEGYMCFMNAGDVFYSERTIENVVLSLDKTVPDVLYGDYEASYLYGFRRIVRAENIGSLWKGMFISHQAMFIKSNVMIKNLYNLNYSINADYEFICKLYTNGFRFEKIDNIIALTSAGGISDTKRVESVKGHWSIARQMWPGFKTDSYYFIKLIDARFKVLIYPLIPRSMRKLLTKLKYIGRIT